MTSGKGKIINDPVYGFIRFPEKELLQIINHPLFQRLRNIKQMGLAQLVYPGAVHTRFHHSLGACHLMGKALDELSAKGVTITKEESLAARIAILLHDVGHAPYSHALENTLIEGISHENISRLIMHQLNSEFCGMLDMAIEIFNNTYHKQFLHKLVSSQLDVDRMDYLNRDSFYTGVSEGVIGYDRILQMLSIHDGELAVEEKGVHSVEKFIIARRLMYWQVYLHKTVLSAEILLINILRRARELAVDGADLFTTPSLHYFLYQQHTAKDMKSNSDMLSHYCNLDDNDIMTSIKVWQKYPDQILATLCKMLTERKLYKVILSSQSLDNEYNLKAEQIKKTHNVNNADLQYFLSTGVTSNDTYNINDDRIQIAMKNGTLLDISEIDNPIISQALAMPIHKNYICYAQPLI
ncbi:MAG: HD domain-containing protein [Bacteroidetes bacterium]|nr:HD domain-containing protein [Bacteroidota bacterium]